MSSEMISINLSGNAVKRIQDLLPNHKSNYFRVYVTGGGCSGFQYGFKFDDNPEGDDDLVETINKICRTLKTKYRFI